MLTYVRKTITGGLEIGSTINWVEAIYTNGIICDRSAGVDGYGSIDGENFSIGDFAPINEVAASLGIFSIFTTLDDYGNTRIQWDPVQEAFKYYNRDNNLSLKIESYGNDESLFLMDNTIKLITGLSDIGSPTVYTDYDIICKSIFSITKASFGDVVEQGGVSSTAHFRNLYTWLPSAGDYIEIADYLDNELTILQAIIDNYMNGSNRKNPFDGILAGSGSTDMEFSRSNVLFRPTIAGSLGSTSNGFKLNGTLMFKDPGELHYEVRAKVGDTLISQDDFAVDIYLYKWGPYLCVKIDYNAAMPAMTDAQYIKLQYRFLDNSISNMLNSILDSGQYSMQTVINWAKDSSNNFRDAIATAVRFRWNFPIGYRFQVECNAPPITGTDWTCEFAHIEINYLMYTEFSTFV